MAGNKVFDVRLYNVVMLGIAFMFLFTAFQAASMVEKSVLDSAKKDSNGTFTGDGYTSLTIIYVLDAVVNWIAPPFVSVVGPKFTLVIGGIMYLLFIMQFLKPMTWALYLGSVVVGFGNGSKYISGKKSKIWALYLGSVLIGFGNWIISTAQGTFLTINSDSETMSRNSGIFWGLFQSSSLFGNLYSHFILEGEDITASQRTTLFIGLSGACLLGCLCFLILRNRRTDDSSQNSNNGSDSEEQKPAGPLHALKTSFQLLGNRNMILLSGLIIYTGIEATFYSGVYGTALANNKHFGPEANSLIGIAGIAIGVGEIVGGFMFGIFGKRANIYGRDPIVVFGYLVHMAAVFLIFISLPSESPIHETGSATYITSNKYVALLCAFLLGLGDSSFNTQLISLLGYMYPDDSSPPFMIYYFGQAVASAVGFYYSGYLTLQWQLLIIVIIGSIGTWCFCIVEWRSKQSTPQDDDLTRSVNEPLL